MCSEETKAPDNGATPTNSEATPPTVTKPGEKETTPTKSETTPTRSEATPPEVSVSGGDSNKTEESEVDSVTGPSCFLCEGPCDITFQPCGHTAMCAVCAQPVKRCPTCKVSYSRSIIYIYNGFSFHHRLTLRIRLPSSCNATICVAISMEIPLGIPLSSSRVSNKHGGEARVESGSWS